MRVCSITASVSGLLLALLGAAGGAGAQPPPAPALLTNAAQVRALTAAQAAQALPVHLKGIVIDTSEPRTLAVVMADETAAIYVLASTRMLASFRRDDLIEVEGVTDPGQFAPIVRARSAVKRGVGCQPAARPVTYQQLITGALDGQWVEIAGVVRRYVAADTNTSSVTSLMMIAADGGMIPVRLSQRPSPQVQEDCEVRLQAVCLYQFNQKRQVLTPVLQVPDGVPVRVEKPAPIDPWSAPVRPADSLLQFSASSPNGHRVRVRGTVTHFQPGSLVWLRDQSSGLRVQTHQRDPVHPGDEIDVLGFPAFGSTAPVLEHALFRKAGSGHSPQPVALASPAAAFDHEDDLVAIDARLTEVQPTIEGFALSLSRDTTVFKGILKLPPAQRSAISWAPGSRVRVVGICSLIHDELGTVVGIWRPQAFQLLVRSPEDVTVLQPPPWWTSGHVILLLGLVSGGLLLVTGVVTLRARQRVREQERQRAMAEAEFAAILAERNRVAREIHDTLAQGLVATSIQLRLARKHAGDLPDAFVKHLDAAQQLVGGSLEEARSTIWNMRSQVLETGDLAGALKGILEQMADGSEVETRFQVSGKVRRLAPVVENNILRIGQEAITNATKHAKARQISVELAFEEKHFRLSVSDNGQGFDPARPGPKEGGFGLVGMRERAAHLKGALHVRSTPGAGTTIDLTLPLSGE